jgi:hypothetical protein
VEDPKIIEPAVFRSEVTSPPGGLPASDAYVIVYVCAFPFRLAMRNAIMNENFVINLFILTI